LLQLSHLDVSALFLSILQVLLARVDLLIDQDDGNQDYQGSSNGSTDVVLDIAIGSFWLLNLLHKDDGVTHLKTKVIPDISVVELAIIKSLLELNVVGAKYVQIGVQFHVSVEENLRPLLGSSVSVLEESA